MAKKGIDINTVIIAGTALAGILLVRRILIRTGVLQGKGGATVQREIENPFSPWKPTFYQAPAAQRAGALLIRVATAQEYAKTIHNAFTVFQDDFNAIMSVFSQLKTQSQVSFLSDVFSKMYKEDLLSFLTDGGGILPWDGLSDTNLEKLTDLVNKLPKYKQ
jgi:hypothetical protein